MAAGCPPRALIENGMGWTFSSHFLEQPGIVEEIINLRLANPFPISITGYRNQLSALLNFDSRPWVDRIQSRCLVIGSDLDMIVAESNIQAMAKLIPQAEYHRITGTGHAPFIEKPQEFIKVLKEFLK
jgi:3-oxoadipate enol-lactonase